jgi:hypothetical protein
VIGSTEVLLSGELTLLNGDALQVVTSENGSVSVFASWVDYSISGQAMERDTTSVSSASTTTIVPGPSSASSQRMVLDVAIYNTDASQHQTISVLHNDGGSSARVWRGLLLPGEAAVYANGGWSRLTSGGRPVEDIRRRQVDVQSKTVAGAGAWVRPASSTVALVLAWAGGGGGGGGCSYASLSRASGGGSGGGGAYVPTLMLTDDLPETVPYEVGAGGAGGQGSGSAAAADGIDGGDTVLGSWRLAYAGSGGGGGTTGTTQVSGGGGGGAASRTTTTANWDEYGGWPHPNDGTDGSNAGSGARINDTGRTACAERGGGGGAVNEPGATHQGGSSLFGGGGGGDGGSINASDTLLDAQDGGTSNSYANGGGGAAGTSGALPTAGTAGSAGDSTRGGSGGGGGGAATTSGVSGAAGGAGGSHGGAGGGGGGARAGGAVGGVGGRGGDGAIYILTW